MGPNIPSHRYGSAVPSVNLVDTTQWNSSLWTSKTSGYTNLSQLSLSQDGTHDPGSQVTNSPHGSGLALSRDNGDREEHHQRSTRSTASQHPAAPSEFGTTLQPCDLRTDLSTSERDQYHPLDGRKRRMSSLGNVEQAGALQGPLDRDVDGSPVGMWNAPSGQLLSPNTSAISRFPTPELPPALISKMTNGTMKREEIESAIKNHLQKILNHGISSDRGVDPAASGAAKRYKCDQCSRTVQRHCDLRYLS